MATEIPNGLRYSMGPITFDGDMVILGPGTYVLTNPVIFKLHPDTMFVGATVIGEDKNGD